MAADVSSHAGPRPRGTARAYRRVAAAAVVVVLARWGLASTDLGTAAAPRSDAGSPAAQPPVRGQVTLPVPGTFTPTTFDPATQDDGPSVFVDATDEAGTTFAQHALRTKGVELPRAQLATLMGTAQPSEQAIAAWTRRTLSPHIAELGTLRYYGTGQAWGDFDRDGDLDLYLTDQVGENVLFENRGDGTFTRSPLSEQVALEARPSGGATFVDYDGDGWTDLHVLGRGADSLFHNDRGQGFTDVTERSGISDPGMGQTATWGDYDGDGDLDAYVVDYGCQPCNDAPPVPEEARDQDHLFRNEGDGTFSDQTARIADIPGTRGLGFSASWLDYDDDGRPDLYVVNDVRDDQPDDEEDEGIARGDGSTPGNAMLHNDGPGCGGWCFSDASKATGTDIRANAMGLAVGDVDGNGAMDLFFTNSGYRAGPTKLLLGDGKGAFTDESAALGANLGEWSWGASLLDVDNDGRLDIYVAVGTSELAMQAPIGALPKRPGSSDPVETRAALRSGATKPVDSLVEPPWAVVRSRAPRTDNDRLLHQRPDGTFEEWVLGPTDRYSGQTYGTAVADYDGDGRVDIVTGNMDNGFRLLRNRGEVGAGNHRIVVDLRGDGRHVNRDAVGAIATIETTGGRRLARRVAIGSSLGSGDPTELVVGLGTEQPATIRVAWPDGTESTHALTGADRRYTISYGSDVVEADALAG